VTLARTIRDVQAAGQLALRPSSPDAMAWSAPVPHRFTPKVGPGVAQGSPLSSREAPGVRGPFASRQICDSRLS
jgi:hypothetical protein